MEFGRVLNVLGLARATFVAKVVLATVWVSGRLSDRPMSVVVVSILLFDYFLWVITLSMSGCLIASALAPLMMTALILCNPLTVVVLPNSMLRLVLRLSFITIDTGAVSFSV